MPHLTPHHRHLFAKALCRSTFNWVDNDPSTSLLSDETTLIASLPSPLLHSPSHKPDPLLCPTHSRLNQHLISTISSRILHEISQKLPILQNALLSLAENSGQSVAATGVKHKHIRATKKLRDCYQRIYGFFFPPGEGRGGSVGGCEGCFVAAFGGSPAALFAFVTGSRVWRKDRSAMRLWVEQWVKLCSRETRKRMGEEAEQVAHWVRKVLRATREGGRARPAELSAGEEEMVREVGGVGSGDATMGGGGDVVTGGAGSDKGSEDTLYVRVDPPPTTVYANPFDDRHAASYQSLHPSAVNNRPDSSVYSAYTDVRPGDGVVDTGLGIVPYDQTDVYQRYRTARSEWGRLSTVCADL
ncbi:hypothetical protein K440DRAFT_643395 [Wilcoxina mikolae CBS 423.85]|nr:hypothetical protein K440DRAFT_643395 [Wilcoxina mikolae CBS 423.85]